MAYHQQKLFPWVLTKRTIIYNRIRGLSNTRHSFASFTTSPHGPDLFSHICTVDAEPLHRYKKGGYHPTGLGDLLKDGRYKILHKLGWGGYSTVWAARDQRFDTYRSGCLLYSKIGAKANRFPGMIYMLLSRSAPPS